MSFWIELHCDGGFESPPGWQKENKFPGSFCISGRNEGPMVGCGNGRENLHQRVSTLQHRARKEGWRKSRGKWYCPNCKGLLK